MNEALKHITYHHKQADGWIALCKKDESYSSGFKQYHYKPDELPEVLNRWNGEDCYFSMNTFYKPLRRVENIRQLRSLYVDIDCHAKKEPLTPEQVLMWLESEHFGITVPEPNYIIFSGRGLVLEWMIQPVPYKALPLWQAIENYLCNQLKELNADGKATDAARIFRIGGTVNSKNKNVVQVEYRHDYIYELREIQEEYLPELKPKKEKQKQDNKGNQNKVSHIFNTYTLHFERKEDLLRLIQLRNFNVTGYRSNFLFLFRYWSSLYYGDSDLALQRTLELNAEFTEPLKEREVKQITKSAEKAWKDKNDEELNARVRKQGYKAGAGYNFTNEKLIAMLDISMDEQRHLKTIISYEEKQRRKTVKRRENGIVERSQYINEQKNITNERVEAIRKLITDNPKIKNKEIAELLSISSARVGQLKKYL
ncbi:replication protein [Aneurinibacillus thermoaerophilus]|uniref:replication protein n=1 Tax=Aneurinibacillus thermoaerophilus TaxID=143495 RepID=UPI002E1D4892|nr:replication protein [Aneurinibacillus thermoaerophilus]